MLLIDVNNTKSIVVQLTPHNIRIDLNSFKYRVKSKFFRHNIRMYHVIWL